MSGVTQSVMMETLEDDKEKGLDHDDAGGGGEVES